MKNKEKRMKAIELQAEEVVKDNNRIEKLVEEAFQKINFLKPNADSMISFIRNIKLSIKMLKAYIKGDYKGVSAKTILSLVLGLVYFVSPIDMIPDVLPVIGYVDDITVLVWIFKNLKGDIEQYEAWASRIEAK
jgi:uncharacterized membrane protein YkvA (DUF1232 family)